MGFLARAAGLTQVSGESATGSQQTTFNAMNQFMGVLTDPFIAGRGGPVAPRRAECVCRGRLGLRARGRTDGERDAYRRCPQRRRQRRLRPALERVGAGFGGSQTTDGNAHLGSNNTTSSIYGIAVGADYRVSPDTLAGFALAGGGTSFASQGPATAAPTCSRPAPSFAITSVPAYIIGCAGLWLAGHHDQPHRHGRRHRSAAGASSMRTRTRAASKAAIASSRQVGGIGITPYAAVQFTTFDLPAYAESVVAGAKSFAQTYAAKSVTDTRSELGIRTDKSCAMPNGMLTLRGRLAWAHDFNPDRSIPPTFQSLPGASFVVNGARRRPTPR